MKELELAYPLRSGVKNTPIVREVDRARVFAMWRWAGVVIGLGVVLVFSAWQHFQVLRFGYLIEDMRKQRVVEEERRRHLLLEKAVLLRPQRLEQMAMDRLHMVAPDAASTIVIERVNPGTPPARGVVAAR